jgi:hypothetical protein
MTDLTHRHEQLMDWLLKAQVELSNTSLVRDRQGWAEIGGILFGMAAYKPRRRKTATIAANGGGAVVTNGAVTSHQA